MAATFDVELVEAMATRIGEGMRAVGVHQGLSPVLDVVRDYRWGRVEETFGEDPYLVGALGAAYVRGLEATGIVATLKHFAGYSASRSGRNLGPAPVGPRELQDVLLPPFERAVRDGARSVMHSYSEVDGVPAAADARLLTDLLRDEWGFPGVVVADYWGIAFLQSLHRVAGSPAEAGAKALTAGVDVELPDSICYPALAELVHAGELAEELVDRAVRRVLRQKAELGLLDAGWAPTTSDAPVELDPPENRAIARALAERSVILLHNDGGVLPLGDGVRSLAVVGPCAGDALHAPRLLLVPQPRARASPGRAARGRDRDRAGGAPPGAARRGRSPTSPAARSRSPTRPASRPRSSWPAAPTSASRVVGDRAGLFGRGTSGEGCDVEDLELPGAQSELLDALLDTGARVVIVVVSGRPYALGRYAPRAAAIVQAFFPGQEGGRRRRRRAVGPHRAVGTAAGGDPGAARRAAGDLSAPAARRQQRRRQRDGSHVPCTRSGTASRTRASPTTASRSAARRSRRTASSRCPARSPTPASAGGPRPCSCTWGTPSPRSRARCSSWPASTAWSSTPASARRSPSACTPTGPRSPASICSGSSSRARSRSWSGRRAATCRCGGRSR